MKTRRTPVMKPGTAFFLILVCGLSRFGSPTACASDFAVEADRYLNVLVQSNLFSGAVLVALNGKPLLSKGYSFANREHDIPNTPQTAFRLGSITKQFKDGKVVNCVHFEMDTPHAAGALYSTVEDLLLWDQALYTEQLVPNDALRTLFTPGKGGYGYGWFMGEAYNHRYAEHGGGIAGFRTQIFRYPEDKLTVIVLCNFEMANPHLISRTLAGMFFGQGPPKE
jgi:CubicO group peptidase (beta-lactamase class C family)